MPEISMTCNTLTGSYEALAMYSFGRYLIGCLGGEDMAIEKLEKQGSVVPRRSLLDDDDKHLATNTVAHVFPFNWCLAPWVLGRSFYDKIMFGIVQYVSFCVFSLLQFLKGEKLHDCCICNEEN
jgi:hypothetical protein